METTIMPRQLRDLPMLTGARFVAAVAVMVCHFGPLAHWPTWLVVHGKDAVAFFFVLSGFVLTYNYADRLNDGDRPGRVRFWQARFARIYPVHLLVLVLSTLMFWHICRRDPLQGPGVSVGAGIVSWVEDALLVQSYTHNNTAIYYWSGPAWSISCEATFYLAFPLLLTQMRKLPSTGTIAGVAVGVWAVAVGGLMALTVATKYLLHAHAVDIESTVYHAPYLRIAEFVVGCLAGLWFVRRGETPWEHRPSRELAAWGGLTVAIAIALLGGYGKVSTLCSESAVFALPFAVMIVALASGPTTLGSCLSGRALRHLGEASYSLYLLHSLPVVYIHMLMGSASSAVIIAAMIGCALTSLGLFHLVEDPCRKFLRKGPVRRPQAIALPGMVLLGEPALAVATAE